MFITHHDAAQSKEFLLTSFSYISETIEVLLYNEN